ncbi:hypothetical protein cyc_03418 [Cyclospora cayetanensis]|uniref:Uncharacterized protein n=1 Tax=Cyclospora cayetanensis TaxID=88456 RepID=A0A1D3CWB8_9EIME|nr:hypothetical protein cyc_03418 [Cyclospora cayetanensis]
MLAVGHPITTSLPPCFARACALECESHHSVGLLRIFAFEDYGKILGAMAPPTLSCELLAFHEHQICAYCYCLTPAGMAGPVQEPHHISSDLPGSEGLPCPFFCKCAPPMPDPWRPPNACDDLLGLHPERTAFVKQQEAHFCARLCLATLRPRAIYGPGLLSNTLPHQTKFFSLHQPLPPLPIPEAHRYHRFTLVDLLEHELPEAKGEARSDEQGFFSSLAASAAGNSSGGCSNGGSTEKSAKATAATIAAFLLSAAPAAALGDHAFRKQKREG